MAEVVIRLKDGEDGMTDVKIDFNPPLVQGEETEAQEFAMIAINAMNGKSTGVKDLKIKK